MNAMFKKLYKIYFSRWMNKRDIFVHSESGEIQWKHQFCSICKIGGGEAFSADPPKPLYFLFKLFSLHRTENLITDSYITFKNKYCLFKTFFSQVIFFFNYKSTIPKALHRVYTDMNIYVHSCIYFTCNTRPAINNFRIVYFRGTNTADDNIWWQALLLAYVSLWQNLSGASLLDIYQPIGTRLDVLVIIRLLRNVSVSFLLMLCYFYLL